MRCLHIDQIHYGIIVYVYGIKFILFQLMFFCSICLYIERLSVRPCHFPYIRIRLALSAQNFGRFFSSFENCDRCSFFSATSFVCLYTCFFHFHRLLFAAAYHIQSRSFKFCLYYNFVWVQKLLLLLLPRSVYLHFQEIVDNISTQNIVCIKSRMYRYQHQHKHITNNSSSRFLSVFSVFIR